MRAFGCPQGILGRLGGPIMARTNSDCGIWVSDLLGIAPSDHVLEVGFGPGVIVHHLANLAPAGRISGIDLSSEMVAQARARNIAAIRSGRVDLQRGSVESIPFDDNSFDKMLAINSMQVWPDAVVGLQEIRRVIKPGGRIALGFTRYSGQTEERLIETMVAAGFSQANIVEETGKWFCALATK
jgi:ubiquinone/menaquinone biosynthesis C-methylase UbiE